MWKPLENLYWRGTDWLFHAYYVEGFGHKTSCPFPQEIVAFTRMIESFMGFNFKRSPHKTLHQAAGWD